VRVFLTGIAGFAGSHFVDALLADGGFTVGGLIAPDESPHRLADARASLTISTADLLDAAEVTAALRAFAPDAVVHLAAVAFVLSDPDRVRRVNVDGSRVLLDALAAACPEAKGIFISSSEVYAAQGEFPEIDETHPLGPANPYAESKRAMEDLVAEARANAGLDLAVLRPFNHIGPRQSADFVVSGFARQVALIEAGRQENVLRVGNLTPRRDFTDVRDVARAYVLALRHARSGDVFNIASGRSHAIQEALDLLRTMSSARIEVETDPARVRPSDRPEVVGSAARLRTRTGWVPAVPFERSVADALAYWRANV
jgi:GDP-4-dehydro-6-deoxy-D-mannose reductase